MIKSILELIVSLLKIFAISLNTVIVVAMFNKKVFPLLLFSILIISLVLLLLVNSHFSIFQNKKILDVSKSKKSDFTFVFVGDSMTEYLGNFDELRDYLKKYYPNNNFLLLNYGFSSTNILSAQERLEKESTHSGRAFQAISDIPFDLIFIESFGHNPLSEYNLQEGLKLQNKALDKIIETILKKHSKSSIVFIATIAPNKERYGEGVVSLTTDKRGEWAQERIAYIKNHITYAKAHNIPLINIFEKSLDKNGSGNIHYINTNDFIHPSPTGIYFISEEIAKFLHENNLQGIN